MNTQDPRKYYLYLQWPQYLAQWYANEQYRLEHCEDDVLSPYEYDCSLDPYDLEPVETQRGTIERIIMQQHLAKPYDREHIRPTEASICIRIPDFKASGKDTNIYNYLPPKAQKMLEDAVRNRLRLELYTYVTKVYHKNMESLTLESTLSAWMEQHGITNNDANYEAIKQLYRRCISNYLDYRRRIKRKE